jgi:glycine cleavage system H lipoate-binding protein
MIRCCIRGALLEVNQRLLENPQLLVSKAQTEGYIAVLMPKPEDWAKVVKTLLTLAEYREKRGLPATLLESNMYCRTLS